METRYPDFEVQYEIKKDGSWKILGGVESMGGLDPRAFSYEDDSRSCKDYDFKLARGLIFTKAWKKDNDAQGFICEIKGKDILDDQPHMKEGAAVEGSTADDSDELEDQLDDVRVVVT